MVSQNERKNEILFAESLTNFILWFCISVIDILCELISDQGHAFVVISVPRVLTDSEGVHLVGVEVVSRTYYYAV